MASFQFLLPVLIVPLLVNCGWTIGNPAAPKSPSLTDLPKIIRDMVTNNKTQGKLHRGDIIPSLPNTLRLPNETTFSVDSENAKGSATWSHIVATGLDRLVDDVMVNFVTMTASATLSIPGKIWISGDYNLDGRVNPEEDETTSVSGQGSFMGTVTNFNVAMDSKVDVALLSGRVTISNMDLQMSYDSISIKADNFALNDEVVEWESVNKELNDNFESVWSQYREPLVVAITEGVNELISDMTVSDLVDVFQGKKTLEDVINNAKAVKKV